jgi:dihydrolipoamide dehydrogenase
MSERFDLVVIGGGPGGYVAAIRAAQLGLFVALVEKEKLGGVCLNWGCIPTKSLLASAGLIASLERAEEMGVRLGGVETDIATMFSRKDRVVEKLRSGVETLLKKRKVSVFSGSGTLVGQGAVSVESSEGRTDLTCESVILATGSAPMIPSAFPFDGRVVVSTREALSDTDIPENVLIVGGGAVGCELAGFYNAVGRSVTLVEMLPEILPGEDASAVRLAKAAMKKRGIDVRTGARVESIEVNDGKARTTLSDGDILDSGRVLLAMGRRPSTGGAGIADAGLKIENRAVSVDDHMRTSLDGVYAIGDLVGGWLLAHVASREGVVAATNAAGHDLAISYRAVPRCTFTTPEIASVGMSESQAGEGGVEFSSGRFSLGASGKALADGEAQGFVKILSETSGGKVIGGVAVGHHASILVHEIALAVHAELSIDSLMSMIHAHPTLSEAVLEAAEAVEGMSIHSA